MILLNQLLNSSILKFSFDASIIPWRLRLRMWLRLRLWSWWGPVEPSRMPNMFNHAHHAQSNYKLSYLCHISIIISNWISKLQTNRTHDLFPNPYHFIFFFQICKQYRSLLIFLIVRHFHKLKWIPELNAKRVDHA